MQKRNSLLALAAFASLTFTGSAALAADVDALTAEQFAIVVAAFDEAPRDAGTNVDRLNDTIWAQIDAAYNEFDNEPYLVLMAVTPSLNSSNAHTE